MKILLKKKALSKNKANSKKRILYVESNVDGTVGGSYFSLLFLIEGLNKNNYEPIVAFYHNNYLIPRYEKAGCKIFLINKHQPLDIFWKFPALRKISKVLPAILMAVPLKIIQKIINFFLTFFFPLFNCLLILRKEKIDLVHLNNTLRRPHEWILASILNNTKIIAHERGINNYFSTQEIFLAHYLSAIVCISDAVRNNLLGKGFSEKKLFRIYNALDPNKFLIHKKKEEVLKEFQVANGQPLIGIVGNIKEWKGQETVIRALKYVRSDYPDIRCLIIGDASNSDQYYLDHLKTIVTNEGFKDVVIFTGPRRDVSDIVNCLAILIHASIEPEPFGRALLEGMALKKPIISTRIGAPLEIVIDGITGILVSPGNPEEMAVAIQKLLADHHLMEEMGKAGYERLLNEFGLRKNIELTESLYSTVLS